MNLPLEIMPAHRNQPARSYPLRPVNEPAMYVLGENAGKKVFTNRQAGPAQAMGSMIGMGGGMQHQAAMLAHQNREMEALERRQARERGSTAGSHGVSLMVPRKMLSILISTCNVASRYA